MAGNSWSYSRCTSLGSMLAFGPACLQGMATYYLRSKKVSVPRKTVLMLAIVLANILVSKPPPEHYLPYNLCMVAEIVGSAAMLSG